MLCSLVLNAALIGEPTSSVPEGDPGKVGGHLLPGPVAGDAGVSPVRAAGSVARRQRRARCVGARAVAPAAWGHSVAGGVPGRQFNRHFELGVILCWQYFGHSCSTCHSRGTHMLQFSGDLGTIFLKSTFELEPWVRRAVGCTRLRPATSTGERSQCRG